MRLAPCILLLTWACNRQPPSESHNTTSSPSSSGSASVVEALAADAAVIAAPPPRADCAAPQRITQLRTQRPAAAWQGDELLVKGHVLDPETLADHGAAPPPERRVGADRIETRPGAVVRVDPSGAVKWSAPLAQGESVRYADDRWVVVETTTPSGNGVADEGYALRVVDARTGAAHAGLYDDVAGGRAIQQHDGRAKVVELPSGKVLFDSGPCAAGGMWSYTLWDKWLVCTANRTGVSVWNLDHAGEPRALGEGVSLAPGDDYAIVVPTIGWGSGDPTRRNVARVDLDTGRETVVLRDPPSVLVDGSQAESVPVAFCGHGQLFALVGTRELSVHRGSDGARLAGAGAMFGGSVAFSASGRYVLQTREDASTVYRLDP